MRQIMQLGGRREFVVLLMAISGCWLMLLADSGAAQPRPSFPPGSYMAKIQQRGKLIASGKAELLLLNTNAESVEAIKVGRAHATAFDEAIGLSIMKNDPNYKFVGEPLEYNYYGMGIAKGHPEFVKFVNEWLTGIKKSGRWK